MPKACVYDPTTKIFRTIPMDDVESALRDPSIVMWVDFDGTPPTTAGPILLDTFHFHPLAVDDALVETHVPKIDDWGSHLYLVLNPIKLDQSDPVKLITMELDVFLTGNCMVTYHDEELGFLSKVWEYHHNMPRVNPTAPGHLLYRLVDEMVSENLRLLEDLDDALDEIESEVLLKSKPDTLEDIFAMKRVVVGIRRVFMPEREVMNKLSREDYTVMRASEKIFFRDIYDHMVRMVDLNEGLRDLVTGALETHLSVTNNRMNEVMKTLTIITTLFMPITFITGFFGMNFFSPPDTLHDWTKPFIFLATLLIFFCLPVAMVWFMRKRSWI